MITEVTKDDIVSLNRAEEKKYIHADSPVCHYCARYVFNDPDFDSEMCETCGNYENFLGIECITWKGEN
jgi:hypothetical protein